MKTETDRDRGKRNSQQHNKQMRQINSEGVGDPMR